MGDWEDDGGGLAKIFGVTAAGVVVPLQVAADGSLALPTGAATNGVPITGQTVEAGGSGILGWLSSLRKAITALLSVYSAPNPQAPLSYRTGIAAADVLTLPGTVTCTKQAGGACTAAAYYVKAVAINAYGRTPATAGNTTVTTETTNLTVRAAFAQVAGATHYGIYVSTDADPKWVARITEADRAAGCVVSAVGVVTQVGGTPGCVDVQVPGTGIQGASMVQNVAYVIPASPVDTTGYTYVDFDLTCARTGDAVAPALTVCPFFYNSRTATYSQGQPITLAFGGTTGAYGAMKQRIRVECRGNAAVALLVASIAGTGMTVDIDQVRS